MRKIFSLLFLSVCFNAAFAQSDSVSNRTEENTLTRVDSLLYDVYDCLETLEDIELKDLAKSRYKLYPTENMYNFLLLDTKTGKIKQIQWSLERDQEYSATLNAEDLTWGVDYGAGRFELHPTQNMYQFILVDKVRGDTWHVQWGFTSSKRWIRKIY